MTHPDSSLEALLAVLLVRGDVEPVAQPWFLECWMNATRGEMTALGAWLVP